MNKIKEKQKWKIRAVQQIGAFHKTISEISRKIRIRREEKNKIHEWVHNMRKMLITVLKCWIEFYSRNMPKSYWKFT